MDDAAGGDRDGDIEKPVAERARAADPGGDLAGQRRADLGPGAEDALAGEGGIGVEHADSTLVHDHHPAAGLRVVVVSDGRDGLQAPAP